METKKVTLVVIVYNVKDFLKQCLDSVINQTYKELQIIIVDDGSTDGSEELCDEYGLLDTRVQVIHQENGGISAARNSAINIAEGEYIMFVDETDPNAAGNYFCLSGVIVKRNEYENNLVK